VFIVDFPDDLLDDIFDGHETQTPPYSSTTMAM